MSGSCWRISLLLQSHHQRNRTTLIWELIDSLSFGCRTVALTFVSFGIIFLKFSCNMLHINLCYLPPTVYLTLLKSNFKCRKCPKSKCLTYAVIISELFYCNRVCFKVTVWKFYDVSITKILPEINFEDSWSAKSAISTHLQALNFDFYDFLKAENYQIAKRQF